MVYGIGTDICEVRRFEKWLKKPDLFLRFFKADCRTAFCIIYIYAQLFALYSKKSGKNEKLLNFF